MKKVEVSRMPLNIDRINLTVDAQPPDLKDLFIDLQGQLGEGVLRGIAGPADDIYQYLEPQEMYDSDMDMDADTDAPGEFSRTVYLLAADNGTYEQCVGEDGEPLEIHYEIAFLRKRYLRPWDKVVLFRYGNGVTEVYVESHPVMQHIELLKYRREGERFFVTALQKPRGIVWGFQVSWAGGGLQFTVAPGGFFLHGQYHEAALSSASPIVELDAADPSLSRIDVIAVRSVDAGADVDYDEAAEGEIVVITGEAAVYPAKPVIDPQEYVEVTSILVPVGAMSFEMYVTEDVVYDENVEWAASLLTGTDNADFNATTDPHRGSRHIDIDTFTGNHVRMEFVSPVGIDVRGYGAVSFWIKLKAPIPADVAPVLGFYWWAEPGVGEPRSDSSYVDMSLIDKNYLGWQPLQVSFRTFNFPYWFSHLGTYNPRYLRLTVGWDGATGHPGFLVDYIKLAGGIAQPVINDDIRLVGDVTGEGKVGEEIETELAVVTDGGTKGGANINLRITYDEKGRIIAVEEFEGEGEFGESCLLQIPNVLIRQNQWDAHNGIWRYGYEDDRIHPNTAVGFIPSNLHLDIIRLAGIMPEVDVEPGIAYIYADEQPQDDFRVTVELYCANSGMPPIPSGFRIGIDHEGRIVIDHEGRIMIGHE